MSTVPVAVHGNADCAGVYSVETWCDDDSAELRVSGVEASVDYIDGHVGAAGAAGGCIHAIQRQGSLINAVQIPRHG